MQKTKFCGTFELTNFLQFYLKGKKSADHDCESRFSVALSVQELSAFFEIQNTPIFTLHNIRFQAAQFAHAVRTGLRGRVGALNVFDRCMTSLSWGAEGS